MKYGYDVQNYELVDSPLAGVYLMRSETVIISKSVNQNHDYKKYPVQITRNLNFIDSAIAYLAYIVAILTCEYFFNLKPKHTLNSAKNLSWSCKYKSKNSYLPTS